MRNFSTWSVNNNDAVKQEVKNDKKMFLSIFCATWKETFIKTTSAKENLHYSSAFEYSFCERPPESNFVYCPGDKYAAYTML